MCIRDRNEFQLIQGEPRQATVVGVHHLVALAEGRAQDADGISPMRLDLEMDGTNPVGVLRSSFRQGDKMMHTNHGRLTGLALDQLKLIPVSYTHLTLPTILR